MGKVATGLTSRLTGSGKFKKAIHLSGNRSSVRKLFPEKAHYSNLKPEDPRRNNFEWSDANQVQSGILACKKNYSFI